MRQIHIKIAKVFGIVALVVVCASSALAQQKQSTTPPSKSSPFSASQPATASAEAAGPSSATAAQGTVSGTQRAPSARRRDPFRTLIPEKKPGSSDAPVKLPPGKRGLVIEQLQLQGIAQAVDGSWIAVVDNKTKRAYFLREKDQLYNGTVSKVTKDQVVFLENPPGASAEKTAPREVVKRVAID